MSQFLGFYFYNTIQYNIRLMKKTPADTAATEITKWRIIKAVKQRHLMFLKVLGFQKNKE